MYGLFFILRSLENEYCNFQGAFLSEEQKIIGEKVKKEIEELRELLYELIKMKKILPNPEFLMKGKKNE